MTNAALVAFPEGCRIRQSVMKIAALPTLAFAVPCLPVLGHRAEEIWLDPRRRPRAWQIKFQDLGRSKTLAALIIGEYPHFRERL